MIIRKIVKRAMEVFEQKMQDFAYRVDVSQLTADLALAFSGALKEAFSVVRQGRGVPAVPLVLIGIEA